MAASKATFPEPGSSAGASTSSHAGDSSDAAEPAPREPQFVVASHDVLFIQTPSFLCDACGAPVGEAEHDAEPAEGFGIPGRGVYLWTRGEETRVESVPLCASCASAIGMTALARWEIEEEEG